MIKPLSDEEIHRRATVVGNSVYESVYTAIYDHEPRGFNAHQRAQYICEEVKTQLISTLKTYRDYNILDVANKVMEEHRDLLERLGDDPTEES